MNDSQMRQAVAAECTALAGLLDGAPARTWDAASLCEGWRVREVVAHMTMPARYDEQTFMAELERCGFDFTRLSNEVAARDAALPDGRLVANLRDGALHAWEPPGGGAHGAMTHAVVHSLDITLPLEEGRLCSDDVIRSILAGLTAEGKHQYFDIDITGRRFVADDLDWSFGGGKELRGPAGALAAALAGRRAPGLAGEPLRHVEKNQASN